MGRHQDGWSVEPAKQFDSVWQSIPGLGGVAREDCIDFVEVRYDDVWDQYRASFAQAADRLSGAIPQAKLKAALDTLASAGGDQPGFMWDSIGDVLLYRYAGDLYRLAHVKVMEKVVSTVNRYYKTLGSYETTFSFLTHSLGTAVTHGALNRLGGGSIAGYDIFRPGGQFHIRAYVTVANVSRVLWWGEQDLYKTTLVQPSHDNVQGYMDTFLNMSHVADPFLAPFRFSPQHWGRNFVQTTVDHLHGVNVHGLEHYLKHPRVVGNIAQAIMGSNVVTSHAIDNMVRNFRNISLPSEKARDTAATIRDRVAHALTTSFETSDLVGGTAELIARAGKLAIEMNRDLSVLGDFV